MDTHEKTLPKEIPITVFVISAKKNFGDHTMGADTVESGTLSGITAGFLVLFMILFLMAGFRHLALPKIQSTVNDAFISGLPPFDHFYIKPICTSSLCLVPRP